MKRTICTAVLLTAALAARAQQPESPAAAAPEKAEGGRIYRTEVVPYDTRHDAEARNREAGGYWKAFEPQTLVAAEGIAVVGGEFDIPYVWSDGDVFLHIENAGAGYTLRINARVVADTEDPATPAEYLISPYIRQGANSIRILMRPGRAEELNADAVQREAFSGSYFYFQNKRAIRDFEIALVPDTLGRDFGMLDLRIIARNLFNYDEPVTVGYDIYSPQGKLLEFNMREVVIPGRSTDTVRFSPLIYHTYENKWEAGAKNPPLYKVMLFTRRDGVYKEYMPMKIGFGKTELIDGRLMRLGKELKLVKASYNAAADRKTTLAGLKALKAQGKNTVCPDYPQPAWFYELCDEVGLYVIDRANIAPSDRRGDRTVGGTPANDPSLADEFLARVKAMYYRSRNFTCVVAYELGGAAGNGYNMYKAYEWLKSVEPSRPILYGDADGEWNTDL